MEFLFKIFQFLFSSKTEIKSRLCKKCQFGKMVIDEVFETSSLITKILKLQNRKFETLTCLKCGYTLFFEKKSNILFNSLDLLIR